MKKHHKKQPVVLDRLKLVIVNRIFVGGILVFFVGAASLVFVNRHTLFNQGGADGTPSQTQDLLAEVPESDAEIKDKGPEKKSDKPKESSSPKPAAKPQPSTPKPTDDDEDNWEPDADEVFVANKYSVKLTRDKPTDNVIVSFKSGNPVGGNACIFKSYKGMTCDGSGLNILSYNAGSNNEVRVHGYAPQHELDPSHVQTRVIVFQLYNLDHTGKGTGKVYVSSYLAKPLIINFSWDKT